MQALVWAGTVVTLIGLAGLILCIVAAMRIRRAGLDEAAMKARLQRLVALNMGALGLSGIGLAAVIVGLFLS